MIGPFRVCEPLGQGGMGVVFRGERDEPRQQVAIKIVRRGEYDALYRQRFDIERKALAALDHPYLAGSQIATIDHAWPSNAVTAVKYHHTDALGSPIAVTNTAGLVIERNNYEPWGAVIGQPSFAKLQYFQPNLPP